MPASTLRVIALVIIVASLLALALAAFNYYQSGKPSSTFVISSLLLCLGVFYYFTADKFGKKPPGAARDADDEEHRP